MLPGEEILSQFESFYATSRRVIHYRQKSRGEEFRELSYHRLASIETIKTPRHNLMMSGTVIIISAILLTYVGLIFVTSIPVFLIGLFLIIYGGFGKEGYYQLHIYDAARGEERPWRVQYWGSSHFIATLRGIIGELPDF